MAFLLPIATATTLAFCSFTLPTLETSADEGTATLFNGQSLDGWKVIDGPEENWFVEDGLLITKGTGGGWLSTTETYADFELELEFQTGPGGNSGVFLRAPHQGDPAYTGLEVQVLDDTAKKYAKLRPAQYCGSIYGVVAAEQGHVEPAGTWNAYKIRLVGSKITVTLNGAVIVDTDLSEAEPEVAASHPGLQNSTGYIGLQSHGDRVAFRNIRITPL